MKHTITATTAAAPLANPPGRKLLRVPSGSWRDRLVLLLRDQPGRIVYRCADPPYTSWSEPVTVATDVADLPFDCLIEPDGDICLACTQDSTGCLVTRRLDFENGAWVPFPAVTVTDTPEARFPSLALTPDGYLWIGWTKVDGALHTLMVKSSSDGGNTWGSGPSDPGEALTAGASSAFLKLVVGLQDVFAVFTNGALQISVCSRPLDSGPWSTEYNLATGTGFCEQFDAAVAADGRLGVVWDNGTLWYRELAGQEWTPAAEFDSDGGLFPQLRFSDGIPVVTYLSEPAPGQSELRYCARLSGTFTDPVVLDRRVTAFDAVVLYDAASATTADLTSEAADASTGDLHHPATGVLLQAPGDAVYLGMDDRFRTAALILSTAGAGGTVVYSYWNGSSWTAFTPTAGNYNLDSLSRSLILWPDYASVPHDWQKKLIAAHNSFWIRIEVLSSYTTPPVGSQITARSALSGLSVRR